MIVAKPDSIVYTDFISFPLVSFFSSDISSKIHYILCSCPLRLLWAITVSKTSLFLMTLTALRGTDDAICTMSFSSGLSDVLMVRLGHRWQTPGPWAEAGPPPCFIRPGTLFLPSGSTELLDPSSGVLHLYSPKITFGPLKATTRLMWPQVKMSLTPTTWRIIYKLGVLPTVVVIRYNILRLIYRAGQTSNY